jgi:hypothetical protein
MGPRAGLDDVEERKNPDYRDSNYDPSVVQPIACHCTDCTIPAPVYTGKGKKK